MKKTIVRWAVGWALAGWGLAQAEPTLTVRILEKRALSQVQVRNDSGALTEIKLSRSFLTVNGKALPSFQVGGMVWNRLKAPGLDRRYPGLLTFSPSPDGKALQILDEVPLDEYVACVTASESDHDRSQPEYLKALAAVIREYALAHRKRHPGYDLCDLAHCQVYQGLPPDLPFWEKMAHASSAWSPICGPDSFYFHQCCGGVLASASQVWGGTNATCSKTGPDEAEGGPLCQDGPHYHWKTQAPAMNIERTFRRAADLPEDAVLLDLVPIEKAGPRNKTLLGRFRLADGRTREIRIGAQAFVSEFGKQFGWRVFPSLWFDIEKRGEDYSFSGRGFGHGIGLCQSGALRLAQKGWDWKRILSFYFPGASSSPRP